MEEEMLLNSFYEVRKTLIPISLKAITLKKNRVVIFLMNVDAKNLQKR